ncbi:NUDIX hydrolase [Propioniciclava tarda]|uniref:NUDIX domain-containing protein n=1 Tax=Propioniciclava tarda TaxID=433330 RepID=A0A4Q9KMF0_PROTD|nr:NUDIX domain-containing protein [Propioniciclava tarda]TBT95405.1 NUDIX domain-containing protein [Propioniciclava tarda]SMO78562.1 NUDIX domain-containing protein [Propioniciclava tarda]
MTVHADAVATLTSWTAPAASQAGLREAFLGFLAARPDACERTCAPGHLTASAMVFSHELDAVALVLHRIVKVWIQPGGHLEASDSSLASAAAREVAEELGLEIDLDPVPVSLDCHPITCRGYRTPTRHFDVRFVARAHAGAELTCSAESHDVSWWPLSALPPLFDEVRELIELGHQRLSAQT